MSRWIAPVSFRRRPVVAAVVTTALFVGWIIGGTLLLAPLWSSVTQDFVGDGIVRWSLALVLFVVARRSVKQWPVSTLGLPRRPARVPWATVALGVGCTCLAVPFVELVADGRYAAAVLFSEMGTGVVEEVGFRGLIFCGLVAGLGRTPLAVRGAAAVSCVLFGLAHASGGMTAVVVTTVLSALFLASTLELRSLWPAALFHGLLDVGVNGPSNAPTPVSDGWAEPVLITGDMLLLVGSVVAVVALARWGRWPVQAADSDETATSPGTAAAAGIA